VSRPRTTVDRKIPSSHPWLVWGVLAVILLRGPVPWFHRHDWLGHQDHSEAALAWHLRHFHASGEDEHGWHIHWSLPWNILKCPCQYDASADSEYAWAVKMPLDVVHTISVENADKNGHDGAPPPILTADRDGPPRWGPHDAACLTLTQTPSSRVTLRVLLCVAQC
jgi:hypothetical protein